MLLVEPRLWSRSKARKLTMTQLIRMATVILLAASVVSQNDGDTAILDPDQIEMVGSGLDEIFTCVRRVYSFKVTQQDHEGRICSDVVSVMSCWGRCDSHEIADWRFPFKRSHHPVCQHDEVRLRTVTLRNCDPGTERGTELFTVMEALSCKCQLCKSQSTACEGLRYRGHRSQ